MDPIEPTDPYDILVDRMRKIDLSPLAFQHALQVLRDAYVLGRKEAKREALEELDNAKGFISIGL